MAISRIERSGVMRRQEVDDLNNAIGEYYNLFSAYAYNKTATNNPNTIGGGVVYVLSFSEEYFYQIAVSNYGSTDPKLYCRKYHTDHGWSSWYEINKTALP